VRLKDLYEDIYSRLAGNDALVTLLGGERVFDYMPDEDTPGPYIVIGDTFDTEGRVMSDEERRVEVRLHIWSSYRGRAQLIDIEQAVEAAMDSAGQVYIFESFQILRDEDWMHGVVVFRTYLDRME
jgi:hypothetical protein